MARPRKTLTAEQKSQVEALGAVLSIEQIAQYFGISKVTFYAMMERDPSVRERYEKGKALAVATVARGLLQRAREGCVASSIFYLKTQARWSETQRHEVQIDGFEVDLRVKSNEE